MGYDLLFPVSLSLALESKGIKTIASQERFIPLFTNMYCYVLDTQFTTSNYISSLIKDRKDSFSVETVIPTGFIRTDKLNRNKTTDRLTRKNILIFDYHVENSCYFQRTQPLLNWPNDLFFRKEILKLAKYFKDYHFTIRGKNIEWTKIPYFEDVLNAWNNTPNIVIDENYNEYYWSYKLCDQNDLIIARHTSIADECISKGYEVILFDYGSNYNQQFKLFYPKIRGINFANSYKELIDYINYFKRKGYITKKEVKDEVIETLFGMYSDGNVQKRIHEYLNEIQYN